MHSSRGISDANLSFVASSLAEAEACRIWILLGFVDFFEYTWAIPILGDSLAYGDKQDRDSAAPDFKSGTHDVFRLGESLMLITVPVIVLFLAFCCLCSSCYLDLAAWGCKYTASCLAIKGPNLNGVLIISELPAWWLSTRTEIWISSVEARLAALLDHVVLPLHFLAGFLSGVNWNLQHAHTHIHMHQDTFCTKQAKWAPEMDV